MDKSIEQLINELSIEIKFKKHLGKKLSVHQKERIHNELDNLKVLIRDMTNV